MIMRFLIHILLPFILISCATTQHEPLNRGIINPDNVPEEELATLYISELLGVYKINDEDVVWKRKRSGNQYQVVKIPQGVNVLHVQFEADQYYTTSSTPVAAQFEGGKTYILTGKTNLANTLVNFHIHSYDEKTVGDEVTLGKDRPKITYFIISMEFTKYFLTPAEKKKIKLESYEFNLELKPGEVYKLTNRKTKVKTEGKFEIISDPKNGMNRLYLMETNNTALSKEQFLSSSYYDNAQMILLLLDCYKENVLFRIEKPSPLTWKEILFRIK